MQEKTPVKTQESYLALKGILNVCERRTFTFRKETKRYGR